ncbi:MAG: ankyrin repeat domain-containing protein [Acidobacteriia bacterium]|nr:ankyrin repeat domain-containing protein [Terriglobia bacterium]
MDVKTAIRNGDAAALRELLIEDRSRANELIRWGGLGKSCLTHPLHFIADMLFKGMLAKGKELPLADALIEAGADVDFHRDREDGKKSETPLIGAASLGAEDLGIRLLDAGARPELRGLFGETALHWAAMLGEDRLTVRLIEGSDLNLKDEQYSSPPLGWAIHGWSDPPAGNHGRQREVVVLLVSAGAIVEPELLASESVQTNPAMLAALGAGKC